MVNLIAVTTLLLRPIYIAASKEHLRRIQKYFCAVKIIISLPILSEIFIQIGYFFSELCKKT